MKINITFLSVIIFLGVSSCELAYMNPEPGTDNLSIFNEYAKISTEKFGLAEAKGVDLVALADSIRPLITDDLTEEKLYDYMNIIALRMREGHTKISAPSIGRTPFIAFDYTAGYPVIYDFVRLYTYYYGEDVDTDARKIEPDDSFVSVDYGLLPQDKEIGYIRFSTFQISITDEELERMMEFFKDTKGLIVDVRSNFGGYIELASRFVSYFTNEAYTFATNYVKNGPGPDDFAGSEMRITPSGSPYTYTKPVMLLHDRVSFSSGSIINVMMDPLGNVTTLGQPCGGGTGQIIEGILANGWEYVVSTSNLVDIQGRPTDNGIDPDIFVEFNPSDTIQDAVVERAIMEINAK